jgi:hypothetical protein
MKCDDVAEVLLGGGVLTEDMNDHLDRCDECRTLKESMALLDAAGEIDRQRDLPPDIVESVLREARLVQGHRVAPPHTHMKEWWLVRRMAAAAAIVLFVAGGTVIVQRLLSGPPVDHEMEIVSVDLGAELEMDDLRSEVRREVARFSRMYRKNDAVADMDAERLALRTRLSSASRGLKYELAGIE